MTKSSAIEKIIAIATKEIGYLEKKTNSQLDSKTDNAGYNNYTKYWRDVVPALQAQPWCAVFVSWVFKEAFGESDAGKLLKHFPYTYCPTLAGMTSNYTPHKGDIVIFLRNGIFPHTGIVTGVNGSTITTIEGNTSGSSGIIAYGGGVYQKQYNVSDLPGTRFFEVDWSIVADAEEIEETETKPAEEKPLGTYTVKSGDTLWSIAKAHSCTVAELTEWNNISNQNLILVGQVLNVKKAAGAEAETSKTYVVKSGDTLWSIAQKFGCSVAELTEWNNISNQNLILVGQVLDIKN